MNGKKKLWLSTVPAILYWIGLFLMVIGASGIEETYEAAAVVMLIGIVFNFLPQRLVLDWRVHELEQRVQHLESSADREA